MTDITTVELALVARYAAPNELADLTFASSSVLIERRETNNLRMIGISLPIKGGRIEHAYFSDPVEAFKHVRQRIFAEWASVATALQHYWLGQLHGVLYKQDEEVGLANNSAN